MLRLAKFFLFVLMLSVLNLSATEVPFHRGVNLTNWFQTSNVRQVQFTKYSKQDFINIKSLGCDVIRLPINLLGMTDGEPDYTIDPLFFYFMDQVVSWAEELEMYLILDYHATAGSVFKDSNLETSLLAMWTQMAEHYKNRSNYILYEIINEPHDISDSKWNAIQQNVLPAIRAVDDKHTIIVTPAGWGSYNNLKYMPELEDDNIIYSFHFYDPFLFTHQGAGWANLASLSGVPFPYDASRMPECPEDLKGTWVENSLNNSYKNDGTVEKVQELINIAIKFRDERNVPIFCGEFGVYMAKSDPDDRVFWYGVVPPYLSENNIPWTMWDYKGGFGLFEPGSASLFEYDVNVPLVDAMGLHAPEQKEYEPMPDSTDFVLYSDFIGSGVFESSWAGEDGIVNYYNEDNVVSGKFCIYWTNVGQYQHLGFDFNPNKDLSLLVDRGYALDFWVRGDSPGASFDIRFVDTKTENPDDHPWRMRVTIDETFAEWDGEWHHLQIPLSEFQEHGSWDGGWLNPRGDFDWTAVDRLEFVSEHHDFKGIQFWLDKIRIVDPQMVDVENSQEMPVAFELAQNYPNPFNPKTTIRYQCAQSSEIKLLVYNALGQQVRTLVNQQQTAGVFSVTWDARDQNGAILPSGIYLYQLHVDNKIVETRKMMLLR